MRMPPKSVIGTTEAASSTTSRPTPERALMFHVSVAAVLADALVAATQGASTEVVGVNGGLSLGQTFAAAEYGLRSEDQE